MADEHTELMTSALVANAGYLIATAARAPSVHNTQPWRFRVSREAIELYSDERRRLRTDPAGREMLISCGAALFGLRLAVRSLGYLPVVELLAEPPRPRLLARVRLGDRTPMTSTERAMLEALPHRHTHRGPFGPGRLPEGLLPGLQHDAIAEGAVLALIDRPGAYERLAGIVAEAGRRLDLDPLARAEIQRWTREAGTASRDGIPAHALPAEPDRQRGRLAQRDFDLGRGIGQLPAGGSPPAATVVLVTSGDDRADWLRSGQALFRLLAHAASKWVFASLYTQPLGAPGVRALIRSRLALPGVPQVLMQLGPATTTRSTARRPAEELVEP